MLPSGVPVICLPAMYRNIYDDKLLCYRALERAVPLAPYADGADAADVRSLVDRCGFPLVVKRRRGRGGESFHIVRYKEELESALEKTPDPVVQKF
ncbi:MAG: ATP-grasp domain-containing protein, partial [Planctomycetota bacterium]